LLKLLVGPLYSDDPGIGLRELLQNAIDAVRELKELQERRLPFESVH
jgi:HSP90 family molecular chaperone